MTGKLPDRNQKEIFRPLLTELLDMQHELVLLADTNHNTKYFSPFSIAVG